MKWHIYKNGVKGKEVTIFKHQENKEIITTGYGTYRKIKEGVYESLITNEFKIKKEKINE